MQIYCNYDKVQYLCMHFKCIHKTTEQKLVLLRFGISADWSSIANPYNISIFL